MSNKRPDMSGDLFPWKFDLREELAEIAAHHPDDQAMLIWLRMFYVSGLILVTTLILGLTYIERAGFQGQELTLLIIIHMFVLIWLPWKVVNELRFFFAYGKHRRLLQRSLVETSNIMHGK